MSDDPVITALQAALDAAPHPDLHAAMGQRWLTIGEPESALRAFQAILAESPAHTEALSGAATAAAAAGQGEKADGYRRLAAALGATIPAAPARTPATFELPALQPEEGPAAERAAAEGPRLRLLTGDRDGPAALTFADVGGLEDVKKRIELAFLAPLREPALFAAYGKAINGGLLLYGPPGCGKTHIARATAGEVGARFTAVGLIDVLDMWIGESEKRLHEIFRTARREAPVVLFLDELDALGAKRSQLRHRAGRNLVNQLLSEMDGLEPKDGVYVLAATNHPWDVDPALKRPGRFDRTVLVPPPDRAARTHILTRHMRGRPAERLDFGALAARSARFSGADLVHLCDTAIDHVLDAVLRGGERQPVSMADFAAALGEVKPSIGPWVEIARNYALYANEGGAYDDLAAWLKTWR